MSKNLIKAKITVTGAVRTINSGDKTHHFSEIWLHGFGSPFPQKLSHYGIIERPAGNYAVPLLFDVRNERVQVTFNFAAAEALSE